jgi:hypothetical protein
MNTKEERMPQGIAHIPPGEGRSLWVLGEIVTYKVTSARTGGAYSLFEVNTHPGGGILPRASTARTSPSTCSKESTSSC